MEKRNDRDPVLITKYFTRFLSAHSTYGFRHASEYNKNFTVPTGAINNKFLVRIFGGGGAGKTILVEAVVG